MRIGDIHSVSKKDYASAPTFSATYQAAIKHTTAGTQLFLEKLQLTGDKL